MRGTPLLMVVFWAYFFLPSLTGHKTDQFSTMLIARVVFDAAYLAEIVRAGILSLPRGQMEAPRSLQSGRILIDGHDIHAFFNNPQHARAAVPVGHSVAVCARVIRGPDAARRWKSPLGEVFNGLSGLGSSPT